MFRWCRVDLAIRAEAKLVGAEIICVRNVLDAAIGDLSLFLRQFVNFNEATDIELYPLFCAEKRHFLQPAETPREAEEVTSLYERRVFDVLGRSVSLPYRYLNLTSDRCRLQVWIALDTDGNPLIKE